MFKSTANNTQQEDNTMRAATPSYLVNKTHLKQKALTLRIPQDVHDGLNAVRERASRAGFVFDIQAVVVDALERAVAKVSGELAAVEEGEGSSATAELGAAARGRKRKPNPAEEVKIAGFVLENAK